MTFQTSKGYTLHIEAEPEKAIEIFNTLYPTLKIKEDESLQS